MIWILFVLSGCVLVLAFWLVLLRQRLYEQGQKLVHNEQRYKRAQYVAHVGSWEYDVAAGTFWGSDEAARLYGFDPESHLFSPETVEQCIPERERVHQALIDLIEHDAAYDLTFEIKPADGRPPRMISSVAQCLRDEQGRAKKVIGVIYDVTERCQMDEALRQREAQLRLKLDSLLSSSESLDVDELINVLDISALQPLMERLASISGMVTAILDLKGNILVAAGWQDICTKFHRIHPEASRACKESDLQFTKDIQPESFRAYRCKNGLWDMATPLMIGDKHVGNIYTGQFFYDDEQVDRQSFIERAKKYGFDEVAYLAALDRVPRISREKACEVMRFLSMLARLVSKLNYRNIQLAQANCEQKRIEDQLVQRREDLEKLVAKRTAELALVNAEQRLIFDSMRAMIWYKDTKNNFVRANKAAAASIGKSVEEIEGCSAAELFPDDAGRYYADDMEVIQSRVPKLGIVEPMQVSATEKKWVQTDKIPVLDETGSVTGLILFITDITELRNANQESEKRSEELNKMVRAMAGRENRMASLKKQNKKLRKQLEDAGMTPVEEDLM